MFSGFCLSLIYKIDLYCYSVAFHLLKHMERKANWPPAVCRT